MANPTSTFKSQTEGNKGADLMDKGKDAASSAMDKARDVAGNAMDKAKDMAGSAKDMAGTAVDKARDMASGMGREAEDATHAVGRGMESLAGTVRDRLPHEGVLGSAASSVAGGLESSGKYLEQEGLQGIADDVTNMIRRNPIPALVLGIGLGFLLAKLTTSSRS